MDLAESDILKNCKLDRCRYKERRWDLKRLVGSGGMPSSHSATVTALAAAVGLQESFGGPLFATAFILASVVSVVFLESSLLRRQ